MPYTKKTIAEVKDAFDKAYEEHKHEWPTKICGPNLVGILNAAGFYKKEAWVGLTDDEFHDLQIKHVDDPWANFKAIASKLKDKNT